jgi:hypothetical protein
MDQGSGNRYAPYRPYRKIYESEDEEEDDDETVTSDSDSDSSSDSSSDSTSDNEEEPFQNEVPPSAADLYTTPLNLATTNPGIENNPDQQYSDIQTSGADTTKFPTSVLKTAIIPTTSLITITSADRDHRVFPQPTDMTLYLPKIYKNVTTFQFTQIKLLSAFFYFRNSKYNTWFDVHEEGRTVLGSSNQLINRVQIREGSYDINGLLNELTIQMNTTPTFFYYPNGFSDFVPLFSTTGDLSYNFNKPGDYYYDAAQKKYIPKPTSQYIITRYFPSQFAGLTSYTYTQMLVAYYYPVLKESFLDPTELARLNAIVPGYAYNEVYDGVVYHYSGLDDPLILTLIQQNIQELDSYRNAHTFLTHLINNYIWGVDTMTNKVFVTSSNLNTSIVADIQAQISKNLSNTLINDYGYTQQQYNQLGNLLQADASLLTSLYNYYQIGLANYYGVNYGSYSLEQLVQPSTLMYLQNGSNVSSVFNSFTLDYIQARASGQIEPLPDFNAIPSSLITTWSNYYSTPTFNFSTLNQGARAVPYEYSFSNCIETQPLTDSNGILYINPKKQAATILTHISSAQYSIFRFRSDCRQTLQIETLPKPFFYRYPKYMYGFGNNLPLIFNKEYTYEEPSPFPPLSTQVFNGYSTMTYGLTLPQSISTSQLFASTFVLKSSNSAQYYTFEAPQPSTLVSTAVGYKYPMNISLYVSTGSTFTTPVQMNLYHDIAGFYVDTAGGPGTEPEIYNYISTTLTNTSTNTWTMSYPVIAGQIYGITVQTLNNAFGDIPYHFVVYTGSNVPVTVLDDPAIPVTQLDSPAFADPISALSQNPQNINFTKTNDPAWIRLNTLSTLFLRDPTYQGFNQIYSSAAPVIGYDDNDISTDFTDYKGWNNSNSSNAPISQYRKDPINGYQVISNSPYSISSQSYFYNNGSNVLQTSNGNLPYTPTFSTIKKRDYKLVHWYDDVYVAPQELDTGYNLSTSLESLSTRQIYSRSTIDLDGYDYTSNFGSGATALSTLQLGRGVAGFSFLPTNGTWDCERFMFKSAYTGVADPNKNIAYIGIFDTFSIKDIDTTSISLDNAIAILSSSRTAVYSSMTQIDANDGFDPSLGSYYEFKRLPVATYPTAYRRHDKAAAGLSGYTQLPCTITTREEAYYSILAFKADKTLTTFFAPTGSTVPYPDNSTPLASTMYLSNSIPSDEGVREGIVPIPNGSLSNYVENIYRSKYEQSLPIQGQILHYVTGLDIVDQANGMKSYNPWHGMVGDERLELKCGNYTEISSGISHRYLLYGQQVATFGGPASNFYGNVSTNRYCQTATAYMVRGVGVEGSYGIGIEGDRDTVYVHEADFRTIAPVGEEVVQWSANSTTTFLLTVSTANTILKVYPVVGSLSNNDFTLGSLMTSFQPYVSTATYTGTLHVSSPQFTITNTSNFIYTDLAAANSNMRGVLVHQMSSGTSLYSGLFVSSSIYFETATNAGEGQFHTLLQDPSGAIIREGNYTVSGAASNVARGMNLGQLTLSNLLLPQFYSSNIFSIRSDSAATCYMFSSNYTDRWLGVVKSPDFTPVGSNLQVYVEAKTPTFYNPENNFSNISWLIGDDDSYWIKATVDSYYSQSPWLVYGNTRVGEDLGYALKSAWQIFYPTMKVVLTKRNNMFNSITDLIDTNYFSNYGNYYSEPPNYPEFGHTNMFFYSNYDSLMSDLSTISAATTIYKWGQESNFAKADTEFQGYYFNSYIYNIDLQPSPSNLANSNSYYYVAVRGYAPTEDFQTMVRFQMTNRYDYGFINANDLFGEISTINGSGGGITLDYNPEYITSTSNFNTYFSTNTIALGLNVTPALTFTGFSTYHSSMRGIYSRYTSNLEIYSSIKTTVEDKTATYIQKYYSNIMPPVYFQQTKFVDPIRFDLLFKSSIYPPLSNNDQFWGLGYNLGFPKANMSNNTPATADGRTPIIGSGTLYNAQSFYKILDDYIYLRLNDEFALNRVDTSGPEKLGQIQETGGMTRQYYAKLLLSPFGSYSQSMIQNPVALNPPLARLDRIRFQWVDSTGTVIDNDDCEWSGILQITESLQLAVGDATIERPVNLS